MHCCCTLSDLNLEYPVLSLNLEVELKLLLIPETLNFCTQNELSAGIALSYPSKMVTQM
jgi:hypothetical protein